MINHRPSYQARFSHVLADGKNSIQRLFLVLFHRLPFQRFHALFNSLFKVLCIFPSRYLFAIGLVSRYLALDEVYHPLKAALSSSPTRWRPVSLFLSMPKNVTLVQENLCRLRGSHPPWQPVPRHFEQDKTIPTPLWKRVFRHWKNNRKEIWLPFLFDLLHATTHALYRCGFRLEL